MRKSRPNALAILLFLVTGIIMGNVMGWLTLNTWVGEIVFLTIGLLVVVAHANVFILGDIASDILEQLWRPITWLGERVAGADPAEPVHPLLKIAFGIGFVTSWLGVIVVESSVQRGSA